MIVKINQSHWKVAWDERPKEQNWYIYKGISTVVTWLYSLFWPPNKIPTCVLDSTFEWHPFYPSNSAVRESGSCNDAIGGCCFSWPTLGKLWNPWKLKTLCSESLSNMRKILSKFRPHAYLSSLILKKKEKNSLTWWKYHHPKSIPLSETKRRQSWYVLFFFSFISTVTQFNKLYIIRFLVRSWTLDRWQSLPIRFSTGTKRPRRSSLYICQRNSRKTMGYMDYRRRLGVDRGTWHQYCSNSCELSYILPHCVM
jgi:hypothetical protein